MNISHLLLPTIEHFHMIGYWIALFAAVLETTIGVGLFIPGSTIVLLMGALAGQGYFDLGDLIWFAAIGAIIGDNINYYIGRRYGHKLIASGFWFIKREHIAKGEEFFKKHGSKSVFLGRFIPSVKEIMPLIAGMFEMKKLPFMLWNILGAIGWSLEWVLPGYFFAQSLELAKVWATRAGFFLAVMATVFVVFYVLKILLVKKGKQFFVFLASVGNSVWQAVLQNKDVREFTKKHNKFFRYLGKRLDKDNFFGLPLTLLSLSLLYALLLFGGIIEDVVNSDIIVSVDMRVANLLAFFRDAELTRFFFWVTYLGKWQVVFIFTVAIVAVMWLWKKRIYIIPLFVSMIGGEAFTTIGKVVFHRARPDVAIYSEHSYSFPSGHATIAMAFYGFLAYVIIRNAKEWKSKINVFFIGLTVIILIGFSRLYLGVHFVSDVWGGYLAGAIWMIIAISLSEYALSMRKTMEITTVKRNTKIASVVIALSAIIFYFVFAFNYQIPAQVEKLPSKTVAVDNIMSVFDSEQSKYTETLLGNRQEPLSFVIITKNDNYLIDTFKRAGWFLADRVDIGSLYRIANAAIRKLPYEDAPMTPDFWNSAVHDFGFEKSTASNNVRTRHHARFWKTEYTTKNGDRIYVGTASFDSGIKWGVTHKIDPDIDTEREFLFNDLHNVGTITDFEKKQIVSPVLGTNFSGDPFFTDGETNILTIK